MFVQPWRRRGLPRKRNPPTTLRAMPLTGHGARTASPARRKHLPTQLLQFPAVLQSCQKFAHMFVKFATLGVQFAKLSCSSVAVRVHLQPQRCPMGRQTMARASDFSKDGSNSWDIVAF